MLQEKGEDNASEVNSMRNGTDSSPQSTNARLSPGTPERLHTELSDPSVLVEQQSTTISPVSLSSPHPPDDSDTSDLDPVARLSTLVNMEEQTEIDMEERWHPEVASPSFEETGESYLLQPSVSTESQISVGDEWVAKPKAEAANRTLLDSVPSTSVPRAKEEIEEEEDSQSNAETEEETQLDPQAEAKKRAEDLEKKLRLDLDADWQPEDVALLEKIPYPRPSGPPSEAIVKVLQHLFLSTPPPSEKRRRQEVHPTSASEFLSEMGDRSSTATANDDVKADPYSLQLDVDQSNEACDVFAAELIENINAVETSTQTKWRNDQTMSLSRRHLKKLGIEPDEVSIAVTVKDEISESEQEEFFSHPQTEIEGKTEFSLNDYIVKSELPYSVGHAKAQESLNRDLRLRQRQLHSRRGRLGRVWCDHTPEEQQFDNTILPRSEQCGVIWNIRQASWSAYWCETGRQRTIYFSPLNKNCRECIREKRMEAEACRRQMEALGYGRKGHKRKAPSGGSRRSKTSPDGSGARATGRRRQRGVCQHSEAQMGDDEEASDPPRSSMIGVSWNRTAKLWCSSWFDGEKQNTIYFSPDNKLCLACILIKRKEAEVCRQMKELAGEARCRQRNRSFRRRGRSGRERQEGEDVEAELPPLRRRGPGRPVGWRRPGSFDAGTSVDSAKLESIDEVQEGEVSDKLDTPELPAEASPQSSPTAETAEVQPAREELEPQVPSSPAEVKTEPVDEGSILAAEDEKEDSAADDEKLVIPEAEVPATPVVPSLSARRTRGRPRKGAGGCAQEESSPAETSAVVERILTRRALRELESRSGGTESHSAVKTPSETSPHRSQRYPRRRTAVSDSIQGSAEMPDEPVSPTTAKRRRMNDEREELTRLEEAEQSSNTSILSPFRIGLQGSRRNANRILEQSQQVTDGPRRDLEV